MNVTFEPSSRNNWHVHPDGQILLCTAGQGLYQERGQPARHLTPGSVVEIPPNVEHWYGATAGSWFSHLAIENNPDSGPVIWLDSVNDYHYNTVQPHDYPSSDVIERLKMLKGISSLNTYDQEYLSYYSSFAFGEIFEQTPLIDIKTRLIMILASLITTQSHAEFKTFLNVALDGILSPSEVKEIAYQCIPYAGFAKAHDSLLIINQVFHERNIFARPQGITTKDSRFEGGKRVRGFMFGGEDGVQAKIDNAPIDLRNIQMNLTCNCFGDHYTRGIFDISIRELITYSVLISHGGAENEVKAHLNANRINGRDRQFMVQATTSLLPYIGYPRTLNAINCINEILPHQ